MPKYSIIIPVYNVESYIKRTLDSIFNQTFKDYEVIVVNDGSTDKSMDIVKDYNVKIINSTHVEVSEARNIGVKKATGEYLIFLDSDDYWDNKLLEEISINLKNKPDLVRFQVRTVTDTNDVTDYPEHPFYNKSCEEAFNLITGYHFVENVWCYAIKRAYYEKEAFSFKKNTIHEDFGLTPLIIIKAKVVNSISYIGYNYYRRTGSIMNTTNYDWTKRKVKDFYTHYLNLKQEIEKVAVDKTVFKSFISNSMLMKICELNKKDYKEYKKKLKKVNPYDDLLADTLARKIKKQLLRISPRLYYKVKIK